MNEQRLNGRGGKQQSVRDAVVSAEVSRARADELIAWLRGYADTRLDSRTIDERRCIPPYVVLDLGNRGVLGMYVPEAWGGLGMRTADVLRVLEQVSAIDLTLAVLVLDSVLAAYTLLNGATPAVLDEYLPLLARGRAVASVAITEASSGSNPRAMTTRAIPDGPGRWRLSGTKLWVGSAAWASVHNVFAQVVGEDGAPRGIAGFVVRQGAEGLKIGPESLTMGMRGFVKNTVHLDGVLVTEADRLGEDGGGMERAQSTMMFIRLCLGAMGVGAMKRCAQLMCRFASRRAIATGLLLEDPVMLDRLGELTAAIGALGTLVDVLAERVDAGEAVPDAAMIACKVAGSEAMGWAADMLIQTLGARGYEENNPSAQLYRDVRPFRIWEGPTEALTAFVGSLTAHHDADLHRFLAGALGAPCVSARLREAVDRLALSYQPGGAASTRERLHAVVGAAAIDAIVWAAAAHTSLRGGDHERRCRWAKARFEQGVARALAEGPERAARCDSATILALVEGYAASIGDVEQTPPGTKTELDPMLRRAERGAAPTPPTRAALTEEERRRVIHEWNQTAGDFPRDRCIHELVEAEAQRAPDAVAVLSEAGSLSYGELDRRANRLAHHLRALGVGRDDLVGLYLERSPEMMVALLGVLKAGAAYVPLDPRDPPARMAAILVDTKARVVVSHAPLRDRLASTGLHVVCMDGDALALAARPATAPAALATPESLAYVIYTSGSTGKPKGVMVEHRSLVNFATYAAEAYAITAADRVLQFASISFDAAAEEIYPCLLRGACLVLRTDDMLSTTPRFLEECARLSLSVIDLPTAFWHALTADLGSQAMAIPPSLRLVIIGGERALPERVELWRSRVGAHPRLLNTYGPTEATVAATMQDLSNPSPAARAAREVPIGRPIRNVRAYVLDERLAPVAVGATGELWLAGVGVARGYLHHPDLTSARVRPDPFVPDPGERMYRTGDLARFLADGTLEFRGRADDQVKIRGHRVELGEIEGAIRGHAGVAESTVVLREGVLVGYVVPRGGGPLDLDRVREHLGAQLPAPMVPAHLIAIERLPLTVSGKIDRAALPAPKPAPRTGLVPPRTPTEQAVAAVWSDVLQVPAGAEDNFFELGGHSMQIGRVLAALRDRCGVELRMSNIFQHPTVARLAAEIDRLRTPATPDRREIIDL